MRARARDQLEGGLAEAVLEILEAQSIAMHPQQHGALGRRHARHDLRRIVATGRALSRHRRQALRGLQSRALPSLHLLRPGARGRDTYGPRRYPVVLTKESSRSHATPCVGPGRLDQPKSAPSRPSTDTGY